MNSHDYFLRNTTLLGCDTDNNFVNMNQREKVYGEKSNQIPLPFFSKFSVQPTTDVAPVNPSLIIESCGFKIITGGIMGKILAPSEKDSFNIISTNGS